VRFLGRKVYLGAVAVLAAAMQHGPTKKRVSELAVLFGINRRTLVRWRRWWSSMFPTSRFWNSLRGRFAPAVDEANLPTSLLSRMTPLDDEPDVVGVLRLLAPMSTRPWLDASAT
jgi:transposase-like protein